MTKFIRMLLNDGAPLLSPASFQRLYTKVVPGTEYGYGFFSWEDDGTRYMGHAGDMPGYEAYLWMDYGSGLGVVVLCSQPTPAGLSWDVLHTLQQAHKGADLPEFKPSDPVKVPHAADYAGEYFAGEKRLWLIAENEHLYLDLGGERLILESRGPDTFLIPHPDYDLFLLEFLRDDDDAPVAAATHGPDFYIPKGAAPPEKDHPPTWESYVGHYRTWNPWEPNFRIILRAGKLRLVRPDGEAEALIPKENASFHLGEDELTPEFICFDQIVEGQALRANLSGVNYYRFFTP
jgi:CubicO group peptidase (beta-lactamase class C family)